MAIELAKAYVQIVPSAKGIRGSISEALSGEASSAGDEAGEKAGNSFIGKVKGLIAAAGIGAAVKEALSLGADLEQSIGGIETLFGTGGNSIEEYAAQVGKSVEEISGEYEKLKTSEETMLAYADQAYKTAGLSANDYMQTVTGFAASLKQSTGDDMEALTTAANQAVIDMADNANKMGTEMASIQNAYQGFAKQNYTMLDNLKLGYGGTKEEMERLLADASRISGIEYNLDNLSDVYAAIHVIQDQLGITGTTAKEAASTFSGSLASMKSAVQNLLAKVTLGEKITGEIDAVRGALNTFVLNNLLPMIGNIASKIPDLLGAAMASFDSMMGAISKKAPKITQMAIDIVSSLAKEIAYQIPGIAETIWRLISSFGASILSLDWAEIIGTLVSDIKAYFDASIGEILGTDGMSAVGETITNALPQMLDKGIEIATNFVDGIMDGLPQLITVVGEMLNAYLDFIDENLPVVMQKGGELITGLVEGIGSRLPDIITMAGNVLTAFIQRVVDMLPRLLDSGVNIVLSIVNGIVNTIPNILTATESVIASLIDCILKNLPDVLEKGIEIVLELAEGIGNALPYIITAAGDVMAALVNRILESLPDIVDKGIQLILKLVQGITDAIPNVVEAMTKVITKILTTIIEHLPQIIESGFKILGGIITGIINCIPSLIKSLGQVIKQMIEAFTKVDWKEVGSNILEGIKNGILSAVGSVVDAAKNAAGSIYNAVKDFFRIGSPSKLMRDDIGHWLPPGVAVGIEGNLSPVEKAMGELEDTVMTGLDMEALNISSNGRLLIESDESGATGKIDELMEKMESLAEYLITEVSNMQLVAMVDKDDVFSSVKQSAEEYKEQTRKPAFG